MAGAGARGIGRALGGRFGLAGEVAGEVMTDATPVHVVNWPAGTTGGGGLVGQALGGGGGLSIAGRTAVGFGGVAGTTALAVGAGVILPQLLVLGRAGRGTTDALEALTAEADRLAGAEGLGALKDAAIGLKRVVDEVAPVAVTAGPSTLQQASRESIDAVMGTVLPNLAPATATPGGMARGGPSHANLAFARAGITRLLGGPDAVFTGDENQQAVAEAIDTRLQGVGLRLNLQPGQRVGAGGLFAGGTGSLSAEAQQEIAALDELNRVVGIGPGGQPTDPSRFSAARRQEMVESGQFDALNQAYAQYAQLAQGGVELAERLNRITSDPPRAENHFGTLMQVDQIVIQGEVSPSASRGAAARLADDMEAALSRLLERQRAQAGDS